MNIFLLHGLGGSPDGSMKVIGDSIQHGIPEARISRPAMFEQLSYTDSSWTRTDHYWNFRLRIDIPIGSLLVGHSMGGLMAAKTAEVRNDVTAICICSPTEDMEPPERKLNARTNLAFGMDLVQDKPHPNVYSLYSSEDEVIKGACNWDKFTSNAFDRRWMNKHRLRHYTSLISLLVQDFIVNGDFKKAVEDSESSMIC